MSIVVGRVCTFVMRVECVGCFYCC